MLEDVLARGALRVVFQPIFHLPSGQVLAHEVLGRVCSRSLGAPSPGPVELIDEAAATGRLLDLEHGWRRAAIETVARLPGARDGTFFLNVDTRIVGDPRFAPGTTRALLDAHGLDPARFVLELTERDPDLGARRLAELLPHYSCQGFGIALDDFGTGHASLQALLALRPSVVKLDRELCQGLTADPTKRHLVSALAGFSRQAGIRLVAEGIETSDDLRALLDAGVAYGQGFLLGMPAPEPIARAVRSPKPLAAIRPGTDRAALTR